MGSNLSELCRMNWRRKAIKLDRELEKLRCKEELYWKIRSREEWLKWRDKNTNWFHIEATQRSNKIIGLFDSQEGRWMEDDEEIGQIGINYFQSLFTMSEPHMGAIEEILGCIPSLLKGGNRDG